MHECLAGVFLFADCFLTWMNRKRVKSKSLPICEDFRPEWPKSGGNGRTPSFLVILSYKQDCESISLAIYVFIIRQSSPYTFFALFATIIEYYSDDVLFASAFGRLLN